MSLVEKLQHCMAMMKSDFEGALDLLSDDIIWINQLPAHVPFGGEYIGKQEVIRYFMQMTETFKIGDYIWGQFEYIESGNELVVVGYEKGGEAIPTNKVFDLHFVWIVKFNNEGKLCYLREHNDTAAIGDAFK